MRIALETFRSRRWNALIVFGVVVSTCLSERVILGADNEQPGADEVGGTRKTIRALRVDEAPILDGRLDDLAWRDAPSSDAFAEILPKEGAPPTERTEFRVVYVEHTLFIGISCFHSDPTQIVANEMARDGRAQWDDHVVIVLDTFLDRRNGYKSRVNSNGARDDCLISNNVNENQDWDGIWSARGHVDGLHSLTVLFLEFETGDEVFYNTRAGYDEPNENLEIHPGVVIPPGEQWWHRHRVGLQTARKRLFELGIRSDVGSFYDGERHGGDLEVILKASKHFNVGVEWVYDWFELPGGDFATNLVILETQVSISPQLIWHNLAQYDDISDSIGWNSRLERGFRPGGFVYLVFNRGSSSVGGHYRVRESVAVVKISVAFRF